MLNAQVPKWLRIVGTLTGFALTTLGVADVPGQAQKWWDFLGTGQARTLIIALGLGLVLLSLGVIPRRRSLSPTTSGDQFHVESHGQQGGITAGVVNVADSPVNISLTELTYKHTSEGYVGTATLRVEARYALPTLTMIASGPSIQKMDVFANDRAVHEYSTTTRPGQIQRVMRNVIGTYEVTVVSSSKDKVHVEART